MTRVEMTLFIECQQCGVDAEFTSPVDELGLQHGKDIYEGMVGLAEDCGWQRDFLEDDEFTCPDCIKECH